MGVTLAEELPFAHVVNEKYARTVCANCMKPSWERGVEGSLRRCACCRLVYYCNKNCQKSDWINHKPECAYLLRRLPRIADTLARLMGRIIAKLQRDGDTKAAFNGRLFGALKTHASDILADRDKRELFGAYCCILKDYLPKMPPVSHMFEIYCKLLINGLSVMDSCMNVTGAALYLGLSALDHSCNPDAFILFDGKKALLRTVNNNIKKYSNKLRISYCDTIEPRSVRRCRLSDQYYFFCDCELCEDEEIDRQKYSLRCTKCNDGFCPYSPWKENPEIRCKVCGETSDYNLDDVQKLHKRLVDRERPDIFSEDVEISLQTNMELWHEELKKLTDFYRECDAVFSIYNIPLCKLANDIVELASPIKKYDEAIEYVEKILLCHRAYLPKGDPCLSMRAYSYGKLLLELRNPQWKSVLKEAFEMLCESHGDDSILTLEIATYLNKLYYI